MNDRVKKYKEKILESKEKFTKSNKNNDFTSSSSHKTTADPLNDNKETKEVNESFKEQVRQKKLQDEKLKGQRVEEKCREERRKIVKESSILELSKEDVVKGIVLSEILGKPKSLKRR